MREGFRVVLTADRVLMGDYRVLLDGMTAGSQTTSLGEWMMRLLVSPGVRSRGVRAEKAPLGLRLVQSALLEGGFDEEEIAVVPPEKLGEALGEKTEAVLVSSGDPLGLGMNDSTMVGMDGGVPYPRFWFEKTMEEIRRLRAKFCRFRVMVGGAGAWQLEQNPRECERLGIDLLFSGYAEGEIGRVVRSLCRGENPGAVYSTDGFAQRCLRLRGASSMGVVEVSRGCGLGCHFCTMRRVPMRHFSLGDIVANVQVNVKNDERNISLISEDFLRYGSEGAGLNPSAVERLANEVRGVEGVRMIQLDHANVSSVYRFPVEKLERVYRELVRGTNHRLLWMNIGIEAASEELLLKNNCGAKMPAGVKWEVACREAVEKLIETGFVPMLSLIAGLPGEERDDVMRTLELMNRFEGKRLVAFPLFYQPITSGEKAFTVADMREEHRELFALCYEFNRRWLPALYWDNQRAGGVPLLRRILVQLAGRFKLARWKRKFGKN